MPQWDGEESTWNAWLEAVHEWKMAQKIQADWMELGEKRKDHPRGNIDDDEDPDLRF